MSFISLCCFTLLIIYFLPFFFPPSQVLNICARAPEWAGSGQAAGRWSRLALPAPSAASPYPPSQQPCPAKCRPPHTHAGGAHPSQSAPRLSRAGYTSVPEEPAQFWPNLAQAQVRNPPLVRDGPVDSGTVLAPTGLVPSKRGHSAAGECRGSSPQPWASAWQEKV